MFGIGLVWDKSLLSKDLLCVAIIFSMLGMQL